MAQGSEEPPFLRVGTEVSAKYRGAFCEASIKTVKKHVKCKIQYKDNSIATLTDDVVKGDLKVGSDVVVKTPDGRLMDGVIIKLTDASTYTVVFDDGDERTLRRTSLCLKGGRHFNESETLDHLPLTDPENFGTPVIQNGKKRKKRRPSTQQSSFEDGDSEREEGSPIPAKKKCSYNDSILGKVVIVERGTRRKSHWFPALGVSPSQDNLMYIKSKDQCLARSFKDGNYHVINVRDTKEFSKDQEPVSSAMKSDSRTNKPGIERAIAYLETGRVPSTWEGSKSEVITYDTDDETKKAPLKVKKPVSSDDDNDESSDDDTGREAFVEKLQIFMEKQGTPIVRNPVLGNQDLDLHKLYLLVMDSGGMEEVTKKQEWRNIYSKMGIAIMPPSASHHIKMAYKKYLHPYELHEIECRAIKDSDEEKSSNKKDKPTVAGRTRLERRSLSKALEKSTDKKVKPVSTDLAEKPNNVKPVIPNKPRRASTPNKPAVKQALSPTSNKPSTKPAVQASTPPSKPNKLPLSSPYSTPASKHATTPTGKSKSLVSRQSSKSSTPESHKEPLQEHKEIDNGTECRNGTVLKQDSGDGRRNYKHEESLESDIDVDEEVTSPDSELAVDVVNSPGCMSDTSESRSDTRSDFGTDEAFECIVGDKIQVKYGRGRNRRLYEAKVVTVDPDAEEGLLYLIHYTGWNIRYDEWISPDRILGKSNKTSKKKGPAPKEIQKNKLPPKPLGKQFVRSQSKRGTKSPSPASPGSKPSDVKPTNGNKTSHRDSPPLENAPSPSSMKQAPKNGTTTRRTRSDRNSFSSNGLDEAVKSPPSKRRQKSLTPEPEQSKTSESSKENPSCVISTEGSVETQGRDNEAAEPLIKEDKIKTESLENDSEEPTDQKAESKSNELENFHDKVNYNSKLRPWSKLPNGIINYSSSESGSPENSATENDAEPSTKKVKVEKEIDKEEIEKLLNAEVEGKEPISAPHSQGSCTSDTQSGNSNSTHEDRQNSASPVDSEQKASSSENNGESKSNSSEAENSKEEKTDDKEETKTEKKDSDNRGKRHRKKKERKRQRQHSMNENSNDGCSSNASPSSKSSPTRPKICFSADLESIKSMEDGSERIRLLQLKINEMRKLYGSLKAEVASIDRRRKKLKKKREESGSQDNKSTCVSSSPATVECR